MFKEMPHVLRALVAETEETRGAIEAYQGHDDDVKKILARVNELDPRIAVHLIRDTRNLPE